MTEGGVVGAGEGVEVGEREAAPGGAEDGEGGDAVGGVEEGAGEGGEVEDLLALVEGFDLDGAEGNAGIGGGRFGLAAKGGDDLGEVVAAADQDGEGPGLGAAGREGFGEPGAGDVEDFFGFAAGLLLAAIGLRRGWRGGRVRCARRLRRRWWMEGGWGWRGCKGGSRDWGMGGRLS